MTKGASVPDQALAVPVEPVTRLDPSGFDPSRKWLSLFAHTHTAAAIESAAAAMGPLILENFDCEPRGVKWENVPESDKITIRYIAQQAVRAIVTSAHVQASADTRPRATS